MLHFTAWWAFFLLPLPWLIKYLKPKARIKNQVALNIPFFDRLASVQTAKPKLLQKLGPTQLKLFYITWILLILAAANPVWSSPAIMIPQAGRNILIAVDISGSMGINDMSLQGQTLNRLDMIKVVAGQFIQQRQGDRLGLLLFGTQAYVQTPLTFDRQAVADMLNDATVGLAGQMTNIGDAIGLAIKRLHTYPAKSKVLILLTDGASNAGMPPLEAAQIAAQEGIQIYTIGIGSNKAWVQTLFGPQYINPAADLDENTLKQIANITQGQYFRANSSAALSKIYNKINLLQPINLDKQFFHPLQPLYIWPLGAALFLSVIAIGRQRK